MNTRENWNKVVIERLVSGEFAASSEQAEIEELGNMIASGRELRMDERGVLHGSSGNTLGQGNQTTVKNDPFAGDLLNEANGPKQDVFQNEPPENIQTGDVLEMNTGGELTFRDFLGQELRNIRRIDPIPEPAREEELAGAVETEMPDQENTIESSNITTITADPFAADIPSNPDQWYNKNPNLFRAEVQNMFQRHPKAVYGFFKQTGNMYWVITLDITKSGTRPWTFLLQYDKDHPHNRDYGGSIKVQLLKSPSLEDIQKRAKDFGRPGVPHLVNSRRVDGERYTFLCTRRPDAVESGVNTATSAVQVAAWAADWAAHFETGMYNKKVWNDWCDDDHFRHLQI